MKWLPAIAATALLTCAALAQSSGAHREALIKIKPAVVMIVAVELKNGVLAPVSSGSGTIVSPDGDILTNVHVLADSKSGELQSLFVVGRYHADDREPAFVCAGKPADGQLNPALDLAVVRCSMDMSGRPLRPNNWPSVPVGRSEDVVVGEQLWILGYPNIGGSTIHVTSGLVSGWTGETGGAGSRAYMKTDAAVAHGNSGGSAINESGTLVGVPTAFRVTNAGKAQIAKIGLVRPIEHARDLLPAASTSPSRGSVIRGRVVSADNGSPITSAMVIIIDDKIDAEDLAIEELGDHSVTWGHSNAAGTFFTTQPVPRGKRYSAIVVAPGYRSRVLRNALNVPDNAADVLEPWPAIRLTR